MLLLIKMNALFGIAVVSSLMHGVLYCRSYWLIYIVCLAAWYVFVEKTKVKRDNGKRKTLLLATWNGKISKNNCIEPSDPTMFLV